MGVYKDKNRGNWYVSYRYVDSFGNRKRKYHRGFRTRAEAQAWEREDRLKEEFSTSMTLGKFYELYEKDVKHRVKENTWNNKEYIVKSKILPYFGEMPLSQITPRTIRHWQNEIMQEVDENGRKHKPSYLATIHTQLSCILNHAVRFYGLKINVARMAGGMGTKEHCEMLFWTQDEYKKFIKSVMDKPKSYYGFELLYWCGLRIGELLALTPSDFDFEKGIVSITKSYQRIKGRDLITDPKTPKSNRNIVMPAFLCEEIEDFINMHYYIGPNDRLFDNTKRFYEHEIARGAEIAGVKKIRVHDLRHSHVSLLIELGFSALAIADRMGHESVRVTYRYAHLFPSKQLEIADRLDQLEGVLS